MEENRVRVLSACLLLLLSWLISLLSNVTATPIDSEGKC